MNITILGAAGFIGTNLTIESAKNSCNRLLLVDTDIRFFSETVKNLENADISIVSDWSECDYDSLLAGQDIVYHLISTNIPGTSNRQASDEIVLNIAITSRMLDSCVRKNVKKVIFVSSGGAVYGKDIKCPVNEDTVPYPITSYGIQKVTIEKLLYLYNYLYGLDYRVVRLANPYGPYQRPDGVLGAVTTFIHKAIHNEEIVVYGDGSVVRDFIYIDDVIKAVLIIVNSERRYKTYNLGCGYGTCIKEVLEKIGSTLNIKLNVTFKSSRSTDVPVNFLDISRYENSFGKLNPISLEEGIIRTSDFLKASDTHNI